MNDTLGHGVGDELLIAVTHRLAGHLRTSDMLGRLGGDEFVCVLEDVHDAHEAGSVADKLIAFLTQPFDILEHELFVSASIGICLYPADGADVDTLVRNADTAMYQAKANGRGCSHLYSPEMTAYARERNRLEGLLRRSIEADELVVHYQVKVAPDGRPTGAEALLRWNSAELGSVAPVRFIPLAEETGIIVPLGEWILRQVCRQMMVWRAAGLNVPKVSVNLSVKQIERIDNVALVNSALTETGLEPAALELEITESVIMNIENALTILDNLHRLGVHLAIDDFGTGYSSLSYLKKLPVNTLKIDRAFVIGIGASEGDEAIIRTIVALAHSLGLTTVAEGVDSPAQLEYLRVLGCDEIQGYFFGKPQAADEFAASWRSAEARQLPGRELIDPRCRLAEADFHIAYSSLVTHHVPTLAPLPDCLRPAGPRHRRRLVVDPSPADPRTPAYRRRRQGRGDARQHARRHGRGLPAHQAVHHHGRAHRISRRQGG